MAHKHTSAKRIAKRVISIVCLIVPLLYFILAAVLFIRSGNLKWYLDEPRLLFVPLIIGLIGGLAIWIYDKLPQNVQNNLSRFFWPFAATSAAVFFGCMSFEEIRQIVRYREQYMYQAEFYLMLGIFSLLTILFGGISIHLWRRIYLAHINAIPNGGQNEVDD